MLRDLALYLDSHAADQVAINSIASLSAFNLQDMDVRAPYGQSEVEDMLALTLSADELEQLRDRLQSGASAALEALFREHQLDVLVSMNNSLAGVFALANYPALTIPVGYGENGRPVGITLVAPSFSEQTLIDIGVHLEALTSARVMPENCQ